MTNFLVGLGIFLVCFFLYCIASELAGIREALEALVDKAEGERDDLDDDSSEED